MMPESKKFCPHCEERVSATTYRRHKLRYFVQSTNTWTRDTVDEQSGSETENERAESEPESENGMTLH